MPRKNQRSVTLPKNVYELAKKWCFKNNKSVAGWIADLIVKEIGKNEHRLKVNPDRKLED